MIVTLDGPAGVGKSSAARALAERLDYEFLDTGAMYRAVALAALQAGVDPGAEHALAELLPHLRLGFRPNRTLLNGADVTALIREPQVTGAAHAIAQFAAVRTFLVKLQRTIAAGLDLVTEGRDQGTVVFPNAGCKFFLTADPRERARRRLRELAATGIEMSFDQLLRDQEERDHRDATRAVGPMRQAEDAIRVDTTGLTLDEVVDFMEEEVRRRDDP